jgi:hypothetical protein
LVCLAVRKSKEGVAALLYRGEEGEGERSRLIKNCQPFRCYKMAIKIAVLILY